MTTYGYMYCIPGSSRAHGYLGTLLRIQSNSWGGGGFLGNAAHCASLKIPQFADRIEM
jgi:hypothetical protein